MWQIDERLQVAVIVYVEWGEGNLLGQVYKQPGKPGSLNFASDST
jgi:hypothetical protein